MRLVLNAARESYLLYVTLVRQVPHCKAGPTKSMGPFLVLESPVSEHRQRPSDVDHNLSAIEIRTPPSEWLHFFSKVPPGISNPKKNSFKRFIILRRLWDKTICFHFYWNTFFMFALLFINTHSHTEYFINTPGNFTEYTKRFYSTYPLTNTFPCSFPLFNDLITWSTF